MLLPNLTEPNEPNASGETNASNEFAIPVSIQYVAKRQPRMSKEKIGAANLASRHIASHIQTPDGFQASELSSTPALGSPSVAIKMQCVAISDDFPTYLTKLAQNGIKVFDHPNPRLRSNRIAHTAHLDAKSEEAFYEVSRWLLKTNSESGLGMAASVTEGQVIATALNYLMMAIRKETDAKVRKNKGQE